MINETPEKLPVVALTMGDPAGVGPEICLEVIRRPEVLRTCRPLIFGDLEVLRRVAERTGKPLPEGRMAAKHLEKIGRITASGEPLVVDFEFYGSEDALEPGTPTAQAGKACYGYIERATRSALAGQIDAICTAPITKATLDMAGIEGPGHTEILGRLTGCDDYAMMLYSPRVTVSLVTIHQSLSSVPGALSSDEIVRITRLTRRTMRNLRGEEPRLAILGLNPHAGEGGLLGREEVEVIAPAVKACRQEGMDVEGPLPPDAAFLPRRLERTDAHICMYHDQGLIPFKMVSSHDGVNLTMGLPIVRTSPDHGTAYAIAWRGTADPSSMIEAIGLAARLAAARKEGAGRSSE